MTDEEIMFERLFAPIKAKIQDKNRYITELEKENAELEKQIDKMKCCGNCKYRIKKNLEGRIWVELCEKSYIKNSCDEWEWIYD